jgi:hypothetical protein
VKWEGTPPLSSIGEKGRDRDRERVCVRETVAKEEETVTFFISSSLRNKQMILSDLKDEWRYVHSEKITERRAREVTVN